MPQLSPPGRRAPAPAPAPTPRRAAARAFAWAPLVALSLLAAAWTGPAAARDTEGLPTAAAFLPGPVRDVAAQAFILQRKLNTEMRKNIVAARETGAAGPTLAIIAVSFLYGVLHAVGPGHGKVVIGSYFLSRRARIREGLMMSGVSALVQAGSAIALVSVLALALDVGSAEVMGKIGLVDLVSYGLITLLGLRMAWHAVKGGECCHPAAAPPAASGCDCGHDHGHGHAQPPPADHAERGHDERGRDERGHDRRGLLATAAAVGLRPCSGGVLVLLFTLANGIYPVGIAATLFMGLGVAITVTVVSLASLGLRRGLAHAGRHNTRFAAVAGRAVSVTGAVAITLFGLLFFLDALPG